MAARRGRSGSASTDRKSVVGKRRSKQRDADTQDEATSAYREMLSEAAASPASLEATTRPVKKRKTAPGDSATPVANGAPSPDSHGLDAPPAEHGMQTAFDDSMSSEASDIDWEQVDLDKDGDNEGAPNEIPTAADDAAEKDISIDLNRHAKTPSKPMASKRLPATAVEKKKRIQVHKMHLCCLLSHVSIRNSWCNDERIQAILKPLLSKKQISYLNPDSSLSQFQRSRSFVDGLEQACEVFRPAYEINARGLKRPTWVISPGETEKYQRAINEEEPINKQEFLNIAQERKGSRDAGAQLFCALLRSAGVDARLVCSLQCLQFAAAVPAPTQNVKDLKPTIVIRGDDAAQSTDEMSNSDNGSPAIRSGGRNSDGLKPVKRFGASSSSTLDLGVPPPSAVKRRKTVESPYPVYWVEAFNSALQKWLPVDPLVTKTVAKPQKFEPPVSDSTNDMSYVIAFEDDGSAKDVTPRYAKAYNAKTRKARVEATKCGGRWWKRVMKLFDHGFEADRDQVEAAELAQKEASEPMPRNVQDFKDHPYYALERHLRRNEVIHPKKEVGKFSGTAKAADTVEPIYRRRDVQIVKSADKWFRTGREIKGGEQPLKYSTSSRRQRPHSPSPSSDHEQEQDDSEQLVGLYAEFQTELYVPPAIVGGRVSRNAFGNLDIHVPSMIPPGGVHVRATEAAKAAQIVGVDYADAVTGFKFKGRRGTAITQGVVVAREFSEAVVEVVMGLRWLDELAGREKRSKVALALWKRFLVGLRIRERVMKHSDGYEETEERTSALREQVDEAMTKEEEMQGQGGFLPERDAELAAGLGSVIRAGVIPNQDDTGLDVDVEGFRNEQNKPLDDRPICIPSPWDDQIQPGGQSRYNEPRIIPQHGERSNDPTMGDPKIETDSPRDAVMTEFDDGGAGGFIVPNTRGKDGEEEGGGFIVPARRENGGSDRGSAGDNPPPITEDSPTKDLAQLENTRQSSDLQSGVLSENYGPPSLDVNIMDRAEEMAQADDTQDARVGLLERGRQEQQPIESEQVDKVGSQRMNSDQESLLSHDPDDEDAEPDWLV